MLDRVEKDLNKKYNYIFSLWAGLDNLGRNSTILKLAPTRKVN